MKPTPIARRTFTSQLIDPLIKGTGPLPPKELNRGEQVSLKGDTTKPVKIGLEENDASIQFYFDNVIKPNVIQNGQRIAVPTFISSPERFKAVQKDGFYRDKNGKVMVPLITYKRESFAKNRELGNKLDANLIHNVQTFEQKYDKRNIYDNFDILRNVKPQVARSIAVIPDYVTITYSCIVFTNYMEQNNNIIEAINFASDAYWGDLNKFAFRTRIDDFNTATILEQGEDRAIKSTFNIILNGYLVPDTINKDLALVQSKAYDKSRVTFTAETVNKI